MSARRFHQVDVFTDRPLYGNALAVVLDGEDLSDEQMAAFARWTQLSETTFLLPPTDPSADYRVRIFTPTTELPFAGHPTLGSCHVWLDVGGQPHKTGEVVQQCGVGLVRIRRDGTAPGIRGATAAPDRAADEVMVERIARFLQIERSDIVAHQHCDNGPGWKSGDAELGEQVLALRPRLVEDLHRLAGPHLEVVQQERRRPVGSQRGRVDRAHPRGHRAHRRERSQQHGEQGGHAATVDSAAGGKLQPPGERQPPRARNWLGVSPLTLRKAALKACGVEKPASRAMVVMGRSLFASATWAACSRCRKSSF